MISVLLGFLVAAGIAVTFWGFFLVMCAVTARTHGGMGDV